MKKLNKKHLFSFLILYPIFLLLVLVIFYQSGILHSLKKNLKNKKDEFIFKNYSSISQLKLEIKKKDFLMFDFTAKKAVEQYSIKFIDNPYYKARILFNGRYIPVKIRLKGATANEHLKGKKKSYRVKVLGKNNILGMTEFSLMDPQRRNYLYEWIIRKIFSDEELVTKKYEFVQLSINEENLGLYVIDEKASKIAIERNLNREGVIVRFNDDAFWFDKMAFKVIGNNQSEVWQDYYYSSQIEPLNQKQIESKPELLKQFIIARRLLEDFRANKILASKVFDIEKMAKFYAITSLVGGQHGALIFNMDFYFNPITGLLEPIPDDAYSEVKFFLGRPSIYGYKFWHDDFSKQLFNDNNFFIYYNKEIERLSSNDYFKIFLKKHADEINNLENIFNFFYPGFPEIDKLINGEVKSLIESLKEAHDPHYLLRVVPIKFDSEKITLDISRVHNSFPIEILGIELDGKIIANPKKKIISTKNINFAKPKYFEKLIFYINSNFKKNNNIDENSKLYLSHKILGSKKIKKIRIRLNQRKIVTENFYKEISIKNLKKNNFLLIDQEKKIINFKNDYQEIKDDILIPEGYTLQVDPGKRIILIDGSAIFSYSNIELNGNEDNPIIIQSKISSKNKIANNSIDRGGIFVLNSKKQSKINYVEFKNLGNKYNGINQFTGSVTFYNTNVRILNSNFNDNYSEDSLNIIKSEFVIGNSIFINSPSDAIDIDFSNGEITNTKIINSVNDGLDFSGSSVTLKKIFITKSGDKGISIGEKSFINGEDINITNSDMGIAIKDKSEVNINRAKITNNKIGVAAYNKKKEFSGGMINLSQSVVQNNDVDFIEEKKSNIIME
ncbi:CotH kinase family protein [Candidatus Pelagibacter sp.]|nr:CotH kinase family protein [Candidatus Pelagibacter sp.]